MNCIHTGASAVTLASRRRASSAAEGGRRALKAAGQKIIFCNSVVAEAGRAAARSWTVARLRDARR
jgi:hypothetical protein